MFKLAAYLSAIMFLFSFIMNLDDDDESVAAKEKAAKKSNLDFIYKATLSNRELTNNRSWWHVLMVAVISFLAIFFVRSTRNLAKQAHSLQNSWTQG